MTKRCAMCNTTKSVAEFNRNRTTKDGYQRQCRDCLRDMKRAAKRRNLGWPEEDLYIPPQPQVRRGYRVRMPGSPEEKLYAKNALNKAVLRGRLERPESCEECGESPVQGHHDDYAKPLDVRWLCSRCHADVHMEIRAKELVARGDGTGGASGPVVGEALLKPETTVKEEA